VLEPLKTRTLKWMCTARPEYQPGKIVVKFAAPLASVACSPRR